MIRPHWKYWIILKLCPWLKQSKKVIYVKYEWDGDTLRPIK